MDSNTLFLILIFGSAAAVFAGYYITQWYHRLDERITQQHETNRLLRKIAGEPYLESEYLRKARTRNIKIVSAHADALAPMQNNQATTQDPAEVYQ